MTLALTMNTLLDKYGRLGVDIASTTTSFGFAAAKAGTKLGFGITREIASGAAGLTGSVLDYALFGGQPTTSTSFRTTIASAITAIEQLTLLPILLGESVTSASIVAAYGSINALTSIFPGSDEASFSLTSFITLVRKEWNDPVHGEHLPEERYGVAEVAQALVAWGALQGVTHDWQVGKWMKQLKEIPFHDESDSISIDLPGSFAPRKRTESKVSVMSDVTFPGNQAQIITADITEVDDNTHLRPPSSNPHSSRSFRASKTPAMKPLRLSNKELKYTLRRLSKMVLAGYGGGSLIFFGVSPVPNANPSSAPSTSGLPAEAATLTQAVDASEVEAGSASSPSTSPISSKPAAPLPSSSQPQPQQAASQYSWWNLLLGRHDREIFMAYAGHGHGDDPTHTSKDARPMSAVIGDEHRMPRFWVLTDHSRKQIVLVFRGTMSLNELAVDLTCEPEEFEPACAGEYQDPLTQHSQYSQQNQPYARDFAEQDLGPQQQDNERETEDHLNVPVLTSPPPPSAPDNDTDSMPGSMPGLFPFPSISEPSMPMPTSIPTPSPSARQTPKNRMRSGSFMTVASFAGLTPKYHVHGGMLRMARAMGGKGKPVHVAVRDALRRNPGFELVMSGHSLGAGVAALLAMSWADPTTCRTVKSSGLPTNRRVSVFAFGPPCLTDARLSSLASNLVTSFIYSHDVVSRLSLGSIRDMNRAAAWLCNAQAQSSSNNSSDEGYTTVTKKALRFKTGFGGVDDPKWFLSIRKTLEANMTMNNLYPPGRVLWAVHDNDLESLTPPQRDTKYNGSYQATSSSSNGGGGGLKKEGLRLFEVLDVEKVFSQIVFARDMLSSHLPHQYDRVLEELL